MATGIYAADGSMRVSVVDGAGGTSPSLTPTTFQTRIATVSVVRPANTTAYAAGQAVGTGASCLFTFAGTSVPAGGRGRIISARLQKSSNVTTNASFRLWLHNTATFTAPAADQAAIAFTNSDRNKRLPFITFATMTSGGSCAESVGTMSELGVPFDMAGSETELVGILEATAAYTPTSSEVFYIELGIQPEL